MDGLKYANYISRLLQWFSSVGLFSFAIILMIFLGKEIYILAVLLFSETNALTTHALLESIVTYFIYFEFIALITVYFSSGYDFPLKYFLHVGITALLRLIIVEHKDALEILIYSCSILIMIVALYITSGRSFAR
ncbi:phosphate-starvation-inducible protein PsiE [Escherichia coli]|uniref:phosphate-starvation-inducible protein PsiE n=1 Tax=Escherichia coli TaxID=562 RepID=UPI000CFC1956|nr:phosphate-starvation-inducible protein PsiE [Escherichia coli]